MPASPALEDRDLYHAHPPHPTFSPLSCILHTSTRHRRFHTRAGGLTWSPHTPQTRAHALQPRIHWLSRTHACPVPAMTGIRASDGATGRRNLLWFRPRFVASLFQRRYCPPSDRCPPLEGTIRPHRHAHVHAHPQRIHVTTRHPPQRSRSPLPRTCVHRTRYAPPAAAGFGITYWRPHVWTQRQQSPASRARRTRARVHTRITRRPAPTHVRLRRSRSARTANSASSGVPSRYVSLRARARCTALSRAGSVHRCCVCTPASDRCTRPHHVSSCVLLLWGAVRVAPRGPSRPSRTARRTPPLGPSARPQRTYPTSRLPSRGACSVSR